MSGSNFSIATQTSTFNVQPQAGGDGLGTFENDGGVDVGSFTTTNVLVGSQNRQISSFVFDNYTGIGDITYDIAADLVTNLNINSGGGTGEVLYQGVIPAATFAASVTYTYTPIPEPSAALIGGLGFLCLLRRRR